MSPADWLEVLGSFLPFYELSTSYNMAHQNVDGIQKNFSTIFERIDCSFLGNRFSGD